MGEALDTKATEVFTNEFYQAQSAETRENLPNSARALRTQTSLAAQE